MDEILSPELTTLTQIASYLTHSGKRNLLVLQGEIAWHKQICSVFKTTFSGDWLTISYSLSQSCSPNKSKNLLGNEFLHAIYDANEGLAIDALAILVGTLKAGSFLVLLLPPTDDWLNQPDRDSLRWSGKNEAIKTPHYFRYFLSRIKQDQRIITWQQYKPLQYDWAIMQDNPRWIQNENQIEQQTLLHRLSHAKNGIYLLTAKRGRGKSALAGMLAAKENCIITAPNRASVSSLYQFTNEQKSAFFAPDRLLVLCEKQEIASDWLIIDEAAAIPLPILMKLIPYFPRVLLTTTIQGYEGTGMGIAHKFATFFPGLHQLTLSMPLRWNKNDPLEAFIDSILMTPFSSEEVKFNPSLSIQYEQITRDETTLNLLIECYQLLMDAHYKTTPIDLRRLFDAPDLIIFVAKQNHHIIGALVLVAEGELNEELITSIWQGRRRPKGNLVAQSLAYFGNKNAARLRSLRINRIAIKASFRRKHIAKSLLEQAQKNALTLRCDYLSVSFGYTVKLFEFWQKNGFYLVHVSAVQDASSGCYSIMMIKPVSDNGLKLKDNITSSIKRDIVFLEMKSPLFHLFNESILSLQDVIQTTNNMTLSQDDYANLVGFAEHYRSVEITFPSILRLLLNTSDNCPILRAHLLDNKSIQTVIIENGLTGQNALIKCFRDEVKKALLTMPFE